MNPFLWGALILVFCEGIALYIASAQKAYVAATQIQSPEVSAGPALVYFFAMMVFIGLVLYLVRHGGLKVAFKVLFTLVFSWGAFSVLSYFVPLVAAAALAVVAGLTWALRPKLWLHDLLLCLTAASAAVTFGFMFVPATVVVVLLAISVYDILAVRLGYMMWMAQKLSDSETLPAFFLPRRFSTWNLTLSKARTEKLAASEPGEREFAILGGGDIVFPIIAVVSVYSLYDWPEAVVMAVFSLLGLGGAYLTQRFIYRGKPTPALPPIALAVLAGFLLVYYRVL